MTSWRSICGRTLAAYLFVLAFSSPGAADPVRHPAHRFVFDQSVPRHVLTSTRSGFMKPPAQPWSVYAPYLTWVQTDWQYAGGAASAGIKPYWYSNPNRQMLGQNMYTTDETTFAHDCNGNRIYDTTVPQLQLMQPSSSDLASLWVQVAKQAMSRAPYAAIFEDDSADVWGVNALPCGYDQQTWLNWSLAEAQAITNAGLPLVYNGLSPMAPGPAISPNIAFNALAIGGMMEGCYMRPSTTNQYVSNEGWETVEDTEIAMAQAKKLFWCYADDYDALAWQVLPLRTYAYASFLLSYDPNTSIYETNFLNLDDFNVMPESQLVALSPVTPAPLSSSDLMNATGTYGRQYGACYVGGVSVGKCAAVVNADPFQAHAFPYGGYHHSVVINGGDVVSGGTIAVNGAAPPATLQPLGAVIAIQ